MIGCAFSLSQELVFVAGDVLGAEVRAEEAGKVDKDHDIQHEQDGQQEGSQGPLASITQEEMGEVGLSHFSRVRLCATP